MAHGRSLTQREIKPRTGRGFVVGEHEVSPHGRGLRAYRRVQNTSVFLDGDGRPVRHSGVTLVLERDQAVLEGLANQLKEVAR